MQHLPYFSPEPGRQGRLQLLDCAIVSLHYQNPVPSIKGGAQTPHLRCNVARAVVTNKIIRNKNTQDGYYEVKREGIKNRKLKPSAFNATQHNKTLALYHL